MLRTNQWRYALKTLLACQLAIALIFGAIGCSDRANRPNAGTFTSSPKLETKIVEVSPPATVTELHQALEIHRPQISIVSPRADETIESDNVTVQLQIQDFPLFKNEALGLGPHIDLLVDNQPPREIYDLSQPLVLENLSPGTHTLRAFAATPWHESFKNEGAYAQTTFHLYTPTDDNHPDPALPLLTYSQPQGSYGAEPILLDFYLTNAPLHLVAQESDEDAIADWRIRCTINGKSFVTDRWQSIYLQGFKPGKNWVKLEFLDEQGNPVKNAFNSTVRVVNYEPGSTNTLSRLVRGEILGNEALSLVDASYIQPEEPEPVVEEELEPAAEEALPPSESVEEELPEPIDIEEALTEEGSEESTPVEEPSEEAVGETSEAAIEEVEETGLDSTEIELDESVPTIEETRTESEAIEADTATIETPEVLEENPTPATESLTSDPETTIDASESVDTPADMSADTPADTSIDIDEIEAAEDPLAEAFTPIEEWAIGSAPESEPTDLEAQLPTEPETATPEEPTAIEVAPIEETPVEEIPVEEIPVEEIPVSDNSAVQTLPDVVPSPEVTPSIEAEIDREPAAIDLPPAANNEPSTSETAPLIQRLKSIWQTINARVAKLIGG